jgi:hypothetical protein
MRTTWCMLMQLHEGALGMDTGGREVVVVGGSMSEQSS